MTDGVPCSILEMTSLQVVLYICLVRVPTEQTHSTILQSMLAQYRLNQNFGNKKQLKKVC